MIKDREEEMREKEEKATLLKLEKTKSKRLFYFAFSCYKSFQTENFIKHLTKLLTRLKYAVRIEHEEAEHVKEQKRQERFEKKLKRRAQLTFENYVFWTNVYKFEI